MLKWIETGSIIDMLEEEGVCYFKEIGDGRVRARSVRDFDQVILYPEMLRHLAGELNELADKLEK